MNELPEEGKWYGLIAFDQGSAKNAYPPITYIKVVKHFRKRSEILAIREYTSGNVDCQMETYYKINIQDWCFNFGHFKYIIKDVPINFE